MDRKKNKPSKSHFLNSGDLIALGGKNTQSSSDPRKQFTGGSSGSTSSSSSSKALAGSSKPKLFSASSSSATSSGSKSSISSSDRKREGTSSHEHSSKKSRLHSSSTSTSSSSQSSSSKSSSSSSLSSQKPGKPVKRESLDSLNVKPEELQQEAFFNELEKAEKHRDTERGQNLMLAAAKRLKAHREKPDLRLCETLMMASKVFPNFLQASNVIDALSSLATFKRLGTGGTDAKLKFSQHNLAIFAPIAINVLANAHSKSSNWPMIFIQLWIDDACGDRFWVDAASCKHVVDNIIYSFGTTLPNSSLLPASDGGPGSQLPSGASSPSLGLSDESIQVEATQIILDQKSPLSLANRFTGKETNMENIIVEHVNDVLTKKAPDVPRNLIKTVSQACGLSGVRSFAVSRLEQWLHNPKCGRQAQELLLTVCANANCNTNADSEVISQLSKLRMKTKPLMLFHAVAVREMVRENEGNLRTVMNFVVYNELSVASQRHPNNLPILGSIIAGIPESRTVLAGIFLEILTKRDDFHPALRLLLREILKNCRSECDLTKFLKGLISKKSDLVWPNEFKERAFLAIADLIMLSMFLSVSPQVREAAMVRGDSKDQTTLNNFRTLIASMQNDAVSWLYTEIPKTFQPQKNAFMTALHRVILKDAANDLITKDGWPPDQEKALFGRLVLDVPLSENVSMWLSLMGLHKDYPILPREVFDLTEQLIIRSATHRTVLQFQKPEMYELLFRLSEYKHPDEIVLPGGYEPPKLAISKLYWQAWLILCILTAHNPQGFGKLGWDQYPTLRILMEMCMTNHFQFPPASSSDGMEDLMSKEIQTSAMEKHDILEFETHLAAASSKQVINERSSLLLSQLMRLDPFGHARSPPQAFLIQLQHLNVELHLGHLLCRSRSPDFLLDLIQKNSQPMPWLSQLVSEGSFDMLPIQCLCEFLLGQTEKLLKSKGADFVKSEDVVVTPITAEKSPRKHSKGSAATTPTSTEPPKDTKTLQLLHHLQEVVHNSSEPSDAREVIEYFFRRLASPKLQSRTQAVQGLQLLFAPPGKVEVVENWLMDCLPSLPIFPEIQASVLLLLRQALQTETEPQMIFKYVEFLNVWGSIVDTGGTSLVLDIAQLITERNILISVMLRNDTAGFEPFFHMFLSHMRKIREPQKSEYKWPDNEDTVLVAWGDERLEAIMDVHIIHSIIVLLLTYSTVHSKLCEARGKESHLIKTPLDIKFGELMDIWFPYPKGNVPKGFLLSTSEEVQLFPLWLRIRMARSDNPRLLGAAMADIDQEALLGFFQSFGFPHKSMTSLLLCLDASVDQQIEKARAIIKNPKYILSLLKIHYKKGATGGQKFFKLVQHLAAEAESEPPSTSGSPRTMLGAVRPLLSIPSAKEHSRNQLRLKSSMPEKSNKHLTHSARRDHSGQAGSTMRYESEVCSEEGSMAKISNLSKQLFMLYSPPSSRRRSSVPLDPNTSFDDPMNATTRRHSSHCSGSASYGKVDVVDGTSANNLGELVDTITYVEPCIVRHAMDYQLPLLFGRNEIHSNCRSFLMTVLTHQAGWATVENLINLFLREFDSTYEPATILDLISATSSNPKLWQGVDKYVPRHQLAIAPFSLSKNQLLVMAEYIVEEISQLEMRGTKFSITNLLGSSQNCQPKGTKAARNDLQDRVKLWLECCQQEKFTVDHVISNLMEKKGKNPCAKKMVAQVYLEFPEIIFVDTWASKAEEMNFTEEEITCVLDTVSHSLVTAIANTQPGKDWAKKASHEIEICLRKLACVHPTLLLRQLPLMGTLLEGRAHLDFSAFHQQNHHIPFVVYLGLLDLMQPHVLKHFQPLKSSFNLYFKVFQNYGHMKDYSSSLSRFSVLLHNFLSANPTEVKEYLSSYYAKLRELSQVKYYTDVYPLQNLLSILIPQTMGSDVSVATPAQVKNVGADAHTAIFVANLNDRLLRVSNDDEIIPLLQDLESFSTRNPGVLYHFSEHLSPLLSSESDCCRSLALSLIIKHVTYSPSSGNAYLEAVIQALESRNSHVRESIFERIHEFIVLCQESGEDILMKIFNLGVSANLNVLPALKKSLSLLRNYSCGNQF